MKDELLSVIVPVYNGEKYLKKCIESIINQTYKNLEIIIVNDGSKDNTFKICCELEKKDARIKIINQENMGVSRSRNNAIVQSTGKYITFVDSDDYLEDDAYFKCLSLIKKYNLDMIRYCYKFINNKSIKKYEFRTITDEVIKKSEYKEKVFKNLLLCEDFSNIWNVIFKRNILENIKFNNSIKFGEDLLYSYKTILNSENMMILSEPLYNYVYNEQGASKTIDVEFCLKRLNDEITVDSEVCKMFCNYINLETCANFRIENCFKFNLKQIAYKLSYKEYIEYINKVLKLNTKYIDKKYINKNRNCILYIIYKVILILKNARRK